MFSMRMRRFAEVNPEWWILLSLFVVAGCVNFFGIANQMVLALFFLPTLFSAYHFGRRHATLTAFACIFVSMIVLALQRRTQLTLGSISLPTISWFEFAVWAGILVVSAYAVGTVFRELRDTYGTILLLLNELISDNDRLRSSAEIADRATALGERFDLDQAEMQDLRRLAKLRHLQQFGAPAAILEKAVRFVDERYETHQRRSPEDKDKINSLAAIVKRSLAMEEKAVDKGADLPLEYQLILAAEDYQRLSHPKGRTIAPTIALRLLAREQTKSYGQEVERALAFVAAPSSPVV